MAKPPPSNEYLHTIFSLSVKRNRNWHELYILCVNTEEEKKKKKKPSNFAFSIEEAITSKAASPSINH
jgi:hypothetical protein